MSIVNDIVIFEKEFFPEAVVEYTQLRGIYRCGRFKSKNGCDLVSMAKKHLFAVGWTFYYQKIKEDRKGLRYESPDGRKFYSLLTACEWYVANEHIDDAGKSELSFFSDKEARVSGKRKKGPGDKTKKMAPKKGPGNQTKKLAPKKGPGDQTKRKAAMISTDAAEAITDKTPGELKQAFSDKEAEDSRKPKKTKKRKSVRVQPTKKKPRQASYSAPSLLLRLIDGKVVSAGAKVHYRSKWGYSMKDGTISREGVVCSCCSKVFTLSKFEAHAGSTNHRPSANMFLEDGRSIQECLNRAKKVEKKVERKIKKKVEIAKPPEPCGEKKPAKSLSDSTCSACQYGGDLLLCDQCPSAFHTKCLGLPEIPEGDWFCNSCCCRICNLVATENSYLKCAQCEHRYHIGCLRSKGLVDHQPERDWCCGTRCERIHSGLQNLLGKPNLVGDGDLTWTLLKQDPNNGPDNKKLNAALKIMRECFGPVIESRNGRDIVKDIIFNKESDLPRLNFQQFYTLALGRKDKFYTAVLVRIHGEKVAEIPFVATRFKFRRLGMCRILMNELEKKLMELGVERMILPATSYMVDTWEKKFGFSRMNESERLDFVGCNLLDFYDTNMCQKILKKTPDFRPEEHVFDHIDKNTISEVFRGKGSSSTEQEQTDVLMGAENGETSSGASNKRRKLGSKGERACTCH